MICLKCIHNEVCDQSSRQIWNRIMDEIECSDFIDESLCVEVVHGEWKTEFDEFGWKKHTCSICGYVKRTDVHVSLGWNYCPNCGAKMDKGKE